MHVVAVSTGRLGDGVVNGTRVVLRRGHGVGRWWFWWGGRRESLGSPSSCCHVIGSSRVPRTGVLSQSVAVLAQGAVESTWAITMLPSSLANAVVDCLPLFFLAMPF